MVDSLLVDEVLTTTWSVCKRRISPDLWNARSSKMSCCCSASAERREPASLGLCGHH